MPARASRFDLSQAELDRAKRWPMGQPVFVRKDDGSDVATRTRSAPWRLCGVWVILLDGISGGYAVARVRERAEG